MPENVANLAVAWTFSIGVLRGHEAAPIVVDDTMYVVTPYPNHPLRARPHQARRAAQVEVRAQAARGRPGRRLLRRREPRRAYADGRIFFNTLDGQTIAVDAATGKELWKTKLGDINLGARP